MSTSTSTCTPTPTPASKPKSKTKAAPAPAPALPLSSLSLTFLGTASAQPSATRNLSALALRVGGALWLFDCGEGTQRQMQRARGVRMGRVEKVFITHTHGDHIFGLIPLMASRLNGAGGMVDAGEDTRAADAAVAKETIPPLEIYGPPGTRAYVRTGLTYTHTLLGAPYVVHELHFPPSTPFPFPTTPDLGLPPHPLELPGHDITPAPDGTWPSIFASPELTVHAAPLPHSVPCIGYADVLVHEATNAHLPGVDPETKAADTREGVRERARSRGHSTPEGAGAFARSVGARKLVLNHFSARYAGDEEGGGEQAGRIMRAIGDLARAEFGGEVVCTRDFMTIDVELSS
ncbi:Metallo-hydrolase/oxidoreductase [Dentipellis sp. KUC8613]|nr:Metallo-hydrolase/oxidoreductase [Dentipellis sp. KUC8613]